MSISAYAMLTEGRLKAATTLLTDARLTLKELRERSPSSVRDLPERLAVLEGLLSETEFELAVRRIQRERELEYRGRLRRARAALP